MCQHWMTNEAVPDGSLCCLPTRCFVVFAVPPDCWWRAVFSLDFWLELEIQWQCRFLPLRDFLPLLFQKCAEREMCLLVCLSCFQFVFNPFSLGDCFAGLGSFILSRMSDGGLANARAGEERCRENGAAAGLVHGHSAGRWNKVLLPSSLFHGQKLLSLTPQKALGQERFKNDGL